MGNPEGKVPLGRPRLRWNYNIKLYLQEVDCGGIDWFELAQDRNRWWELEEKKNIIVVGVRTLSGPDAP